MNSVNITELAQQLERYQYCTANKSETNAWDAQLKMETICKELPSGSGLDAGVEFDLQASRPNRLVFETSYHHMDEHGSYDGWTDHSIIVTPSLTRGFELRITGKNRNQIKEYLYDLFNNVFEIN
jgi:hypothetical protein